MSDSRAANATSSPRRRGPMQVSAPVRPVSWVPAFMPEARLRHDADMTLEIDELQSVLGSRCFEPIPEALRQTAGHGKFVSRPVVDLPEVDWDMGDQGGGCIPGLEGSGVKIDRHTLGQGIAHVGAGYAQQR